MLFSCVIGISSSILEKFGKDRNCVGVLNDSSWDLVGKEPVCCVGGATETLK